MERLCNPWLDLRASFMHAGSRTSLAFAFLLLISLRVAALDMSGCAAQQFVVDSWKSRVKSDEDAIQRLKQSQGENSPSLSVLNATLQMDEKSLDQANAQLAECQKLANPDSSPQIGSKNLPPNSNVAVSSFGNEFEIPGLGTLRLGKPDPRTHKIGATLMVGTDQLQNMPRNSILDMSGDLQGTTLNLRGSTVTKGNYLDFDHEVPSYEYTLSIECLLDQQHARLDGTASLVKSERFRKDRGTTIQRVAIGAPITQPCSVLSLAASSDHAFRSPQIFEGGRSIPFSPSAASPSGPGPHLAIFFKAVLTDGPVDQPFTIQDFTVVVRANLACAPRSKGEWKLVSGVANLVVGSTDPPSVELRNLREGGLYKITYDVHDGKPPSEANILLPLAGAEVKDRMLADIRAANQYAESFDKKQNWFEQVTFLRSFQRYSGLATMGTWTYGNYRGRPDSAINPTVWLYNGVSDNIVIKKLQPTGLGAVATWYGIPVRVAKLSNFIVGYTVQKIRVPTWMQGLAQWVGTPNDASGNDSWSAGVDLAKNKIKMSDLKPIIMKLRLETDDHQKTVNLWPNPALVDNFKVPNKFTDINRQFTHAGFLSWVN